MTTPKDNGGPIASGMEIQTCGENSRMLPVGGMALRDWFAGMALKGIAAMTIQAGSQTRSSPEDVKKLLAEASYGIADAMLAVRKEGV